MKTFLKLIAPVFAIVMAFAADASAATLYATTVNNDLVSFDSENSCVILTEVGISGLQDGEQILGIDFRPATRELFALGSSSRLYKINTTTGVATAVGSPFTPALDGTSFGFDFNPTVDRIRIISDTGQNLRVNPNDGAVIVDGMLAFGTGDANEGTAPTAVAAAYTNSFFGPPNPTTPTRTTALFDIDTALDILVTQNPANAGTLQTRGSLGINTNDLAGFDIQTTGTADARINTAFAAFKESGKTRDKGGCGNSSLFSINLATGQATSLGSIGTQQPVLGLAAVIN